MGSALDLTGYKLTFDDEFNTFRSSPDGGAGQWKTKFYFDGRSLPSNGEQEFYSDSSVGVNPFALDNGALEITAKPSTNTAASGGLPYTSGLITTENNFSQTYGYFEMRAKLPEGQGMWPAFWLLPTDKSWPPEIDALEAFGAPNSRGEGGSDTYHFGSIGGGGEWTKVDANIYDSYHSYGVDWQADKLTYYFDGQQVGQTATPAGFNKPMYMLANLAVGGNWAESASGATAQMDIDYIRAYSNDPNARAVAQQPISSPDGANTSSGASPAVAQPPASPSPVPVPVLDVATGSPATSDTNKLVLRVSEDAWQGDAKFAVTVDGKQVGGAMTATASHAAGQWQDVSVNGDFGPGAHKVGITFLNDAYGGTAATDRNLYVDGVEFDGRHYDLQSALHKPYATASVTVDGTAAANPSAPTLPSTGTPETSTGPNKLVLRVSEDAWQGDAKFAVTVDGKQVGGAMTATASHAAGQWQDVSVNGDFGPGAHKVGITFLNDAYGGTAATDRNLYVDGVEFDGRHYDLQSSLHKPYATASVTVDGTAAANPQALPPAPSPSSISNFSTVASPETHLALAEGRENTSDWHAPDPVYSGGEGMALVPGSDQVWQMGTQAEGHAYGHFWH